MAQIVLTDHAMIFSRPLRPALCSVVPLALLPALAHAHPGHDGHELTWDFGSGFIHPLIGFDHLLAMVAVGLWASQLGRRARWLIPGSFVVAMMVGALLANSFATPGWIEQGIAASVLALGLLVVTATRLPMAVGIGLTAGFALLHGIAHGSEMATGASPLAYGLGFVLATALLHAFGLALGLFTARRHAWLHRGAGTVLVLAGGWLLAT